MLLPIAFGREGLAGSAVAYQDPEGAAVRQAEPWRSREPFIRKAYRDDHGLELVVLTEHDIRVQPRLANCQMMLQHRPFVADPATLLLLRQTLETMDFPTAIGMMVDRAIERGADGSLRPPCLRTFERRVADMDPIERDLARKGPAYVNQKYSTWQTLPLPDRPYETVEVDHCTLDIRVLSESMLQETINAIRTNPSQKKLRRGLARYLDGNELRHHRSDIAIGNPAAKEDRFLSASKPVAPSPSVWEPSPARFAEVHPEEDLDFLNGAPLESSYDD